MRAIVARFKYRPVKATSCTTVDLGSSARPGGRIPNRGINQPQAPSGRGPLKMRLSVLSRGAGSLVQPCLTQITGLSDLGRGVQLTAGCRPKR
jgi:hypothetical protein